MGLDYGQLSGISADDYRKQMAACFDRSKAMKSDAKDLSKIENLLDLRKGALAKEEYFVSETRCKCGRTLTFYDLVLGSLLDSGHTKSFVVHTLFGSKNFIQPKRQVKCSECGELHTMNYETPSYGCCN